MPDLDHQVIAVQLVIRDALDANDATRLETSVGALPAKGYGEALELLEPHLCASACGVCMGDPRRELEPFEPAGPRLVLDEDVRLPYVVVAHVHAVVRDLCVPHEL